MAVVIKDTTVLSADLDDGVLHAALAVEGDRITALGPSDEIALRFCGAS